MKKKSPWAWIPTLYFAEGLPNVLVTAVSVVMLMQMGLNDKEIGLYTGWLALPWVIKPFWSPFIDLLKTKRWWVLMMQILMGAALAGIALFLPTDWWFQATMALLFVIAFSSATHDIAADGFYMIELDSHGQAKFVGIRNTFYRLAVIFGNSVLIFIAGILNRHYEHATTWSLLFYGLSALVLLLWLWHCRQMPCPKNDQQSHQSIVEVALGLKNTLTTFFTKFHWHQTIVVMLFLLLYRFPEALLNTMSKTFLMRPQAEGGLGLTEQDYGIAYGTVGLIGLLLGGILGGILVSKDGIKRWLWPMVLSLTLPDIIYVLLSFYPGIANLWVVSTGLFIEQFGYGLGFTALTLYMLYYCHGQFKTSHYAICTGLSYLGLMLPGMLSGYLKEAVGYQTFFIIVMISCTITFVVTAFIHVDAEFGKKK